MRESRKLRIICDIDDVIVNATAVKRALALSAVDLGVSPKQFWSAYRAVRRQGKFSPSALASALPLTVQGQRKNITERYWWPFNDVDQYTYSDAKRFLKWCKQQRHSVVLYTYGAPAVQRKKIHALRRLLPSVRAVITTDSAKRMDFPQCVTSGQPWVWLDDFKRVPVHDKTFWGGTLIYVRRRKEQRLLEEIQMVKNLDQAITFIREGTRP